MSPPEPFFREAGAGPGVVCLHSNASHSGQWRELMDLLSPTCHVLAPDGYDAGKSPAWPADHQPMRLDDEVALLEPVLARAGSPLVLVGHSYGAAVALIAALRHPGRVRALALYEPTLFSLLEQETPAPNEADGIRHAVGAAGEALDRGDTDTAAQHFIDYWMGPGSWAATPTARKPAMAESVRQVRRWGDALFNDTTPLAAFRTLDVPVLYMVGQRSPASAQGVARLLCDTLPRVKRLMLADLGHMGPITHPQPVNAAIAGFLNGL
ncbi:alpha/beta fold hydrolase [Hydrogenophaga sp. A37]|uniref:alpha/beta fold hydrolase n=1 Tax=Hydrogenophaga sp. A37 TaxID=1945864 RepID=UPI000984BA02|nr:alpha/beta hydrolase [Hydrogenophaga sp. A37]OOG79657.1 alpha/beta hydrolase [Hydrogenophaga sp. A37]